MKKIQNIYNQNISNVLNYGPTIATIIITISFAFYNTWSYNSSIGQIMTGIPIIGILVFVVLTAVAESWPLIPGIILLSYFIKYSIDTIKYFTS